jgi:hypothetical protein
MRGSRRAAGWFGRAVPAIVLFIAASPCLADDGNQAGAGPRTESAPRPTDEIHVESVERGRRPAGKSPSLESLLHLPSGFVTTEPDAVAGAGETEWRRRFVKAEREFEEAEASLKATKIELDKIAGEGGASQWSITPPGASEGGGSSTSPLSFKLRQQLRDDREGIETKERALRDLRIEADLAGVPQNWRVAEADAANPGEERD